MEKMDIVKDHFNNEAPEFDDIIFKVIPHYSTMINALVDALPFKDTDSPTIIDLGTGTGNLAWQIKQRFPLATLTCVDMAPQMLQQAKNKLSDYSDIEYVLADFYHYTAPKDTDAIVSSLALHHLVTDNDKNKIYAQLIASLRTGGAFYNADVVLGNTDHMVKLNEQRWIDYMSQSYSHDEIENNWLKKHRQEDYPAVLINQLKWLSSAGLINLDIIWKYFNFAVYGGIKA
jgi:tRNA (cmo5U34)-methyltransferase